MARKKPERRKHTAMVRMDEDAFEHAKIAAALMRMSLADYISELVRKGSQTDVSREAKKLAGGGK